MKVIFKYLLVLMVISVAPDGRPDEDKHLYSTWEVLELDTCASAWLLKKSIDKEARFKFYPKEEFIMEGIPFDTPYAELRRRHGMSCFETIIAKYKIDDTVILELGKVIHNIEVNYWDTNLSADAGELNRTINKIIVESKTPDECLLRSFSAFDSFYNSIQEKKALNSY